MEIAEKQNRSTVKETLEAVILKGNIKLLQILLRRKLRCGHKNNN